MVRCPVGGLRRASVWLRLRSPRAAPRGLCLPPLLLEQCHPSCGGHSSVPRALTVLRPLACGFLHEAFASLVV